MYPRLNRYLRIVNPYGPYIEAMLLALALGCWIGLGSMPLISTFGLTCRRMSWTPPKRCGTDGLSNGESSHATRSE